MTALFAIATEYRDAAEKLADLDLDEQTVADTLEGLSGDLEVKAQNVAMFIRNVEVTAHAINEHIKAQQARAKALERRAESLRSYLDRCMQLAGIEKISAPGIVISYRKSQAVVIDGEDLIPDEFMRKPEPPPPSPDKKAIADAIKAGRDVPGAHLETRKNLQIK